MFEILEYFSYFRDKMYPMAVSDSVAFYQYNAGHVQVILIKQAGSNV